MEKEIRIAKRWLAMATLLFVLSTIGQVILMSAGSASASSGEAWTRRDVATVIDLLKDIARK